MRTFDATARLTTAALLTVVASSALALPPPGLRPEERAMLPRYCEYVQGTAVGEARQAEYKRLMDLYGFPWSHMHHYCWALIDIARLERAAIARPQGWANASRALNNIDYVLERCDSSFAPRAEVLASKAKLLMRTRNLEAAAETAQALTTEFPSFADGYTILAEILLRSGQRDEAVKILEVGANAATDKDRFARLKSILPLN